MPLADVNGLKIAYDERGPADAPAILLIMGLGTQMIAWPDEFVQGLAAAGYRVIRYDNRDIGLSTALDGAFTQLAPEAPQIDRMTALAAAPSCLTYIG